MTGNKLNVSDPSWIKVKLLLATNFDEGLESLFRY